MAEDDLERAAVERQERLRALREAVKLVQPEDNQPEQQQEPEDEADGDRENKLEDEVKFRNYIPRDKELQINKLIPPSLPKFDDPVADVPVVNNTAEDPFVSIAPKKSNWDLRRDVSKKLEKLERRTQRALIELMQEEEKRRQELAEVDGEVHEE